MQESKKDITDEYVKPHKKVSKPVTEGNLQVVLDKYSLILKLCFAQRGPYKGGYAIAHMQIEEKKPLRFFVTHTGEVVINPEISRHSNYKVPHLEGCLSFPDKSMTEVDRWQKCEVEYQTLTNESKLSDKIKKKLSGREAKIFQHEIDHFDGKTIYD